MSVCVNEKGDEIIMTCKCGCDNGWRIRLDPCWDDPDCDEFAFMSYLSNDVDYDKHSILEKLKRLWYVIINKNYYFNDVIMTKDEVKLLIKYMNNMINGFNK